MFKLLTEENKAALIKGRRIIKYPVDGEPVDTLPVNFDDGGKVYIVESVNGIGGINLEMEYRKEMEASIDISSMRLSIGSLHKELADMIQERIWWLPW